MVHAINRKSLACNRHRYLFKGIVQDNYEKCLWICRLFVWYFLRLRCGVNTYQHIRATLWHARRTTRNWNRNFGEHCMYHATNSIKLIIFLKIATYLGNHITNFVITCYDKSQLQLKPLKIESTQIEQNTEKKELKSTLMIEECEEERKETDRLLS